MRCLACNRAAFLAPPPPGPYDALLTYLPDTTAIRRRRQSVDLEDAASIRQRYADAPSGTKGDVARAMATEYGLSAVYVTLIGQGLRRQG